MILSFVKNLEQARQAVAAQRETRVDVAAPARREFKKLAAQNALYFEICTRDGCLESNLTTQFPRGVHFPHTDWDENLRKLQICISDPSVVDATGYYHG